MDVLSATVSGTPVDYALTAGKDGHVLVLDLAHGKNEEEPSILTDTKAHTKKVNAVVWRSTPSTSDSLTSPSFLTASADKTVKFWDLKDSGKGGLKATAQFTYKKHSGEVTGLGVQATGNYFGTCSVDSTWTLADFETGTELLKVSHPEVTKGYSCLSFHPDGLLLGTGSTDGTFRIWDVKSQSNVQSFKTTPPGQKVTSISFSENGYYVSTTTSSSKEVQIWDLRKLSNIYTVTLPETVRAVSLAKFDASAQFLGIAYDQSVGYALF